MAHDVYEEFRASGKELIDKAKEILQEGNIRRMVIKNRDGEILFVLPLTVGVVGVGGAFALAPILSTIAAFAFFVHDARIMVERYPDDVRTGLVNQLDDDPFDDGDCDPKTGHKKGGTRHGDGTDPYEIDADFEVMKP